MLPPQQRSAYPTSTAHLVAAGGPHPRHVAHQQAQLRLLPRPDRCASAAQRVGQEVIGCPRRNVGPRHGSGSGG